MKEKGQNQTLIVMKTTIPGADLRKIREEEEKKEEKNRWKKKKRKKRKTKGSSAPPLQIEPTEATASEMDWTTWMAMYLGFKTPQTREIREKGSS